MLEDVSLDVRAGELVVLVGPSGSGKTTLLSILSGLMRADAGHVRLAGRTLDRASEVELAEVRRASVGFVYQAFHLFEALTARDNVAEILALRGAPLAEARREADRRLAAVGLAERARHRPGELSAGQRQRVAIARAFAGDPAVVFADEPTAALDARTAIDVMKLFREAVAAERCAIVVTHDARLRAWADRTFELEDGHLREVA